VNGRFLLDTSVVIWTLSEDHKLSPRAKRILSFLNASLFVSAVSAWEIVIKSAAAKLRLHNSLTAILDQILYGSPWTILPMTGEHLPLLTALPILHKDPFDRMLIAQAQYEGLTIVTPDQQIRKYEVRTIW
jgi:PIN domain nuclease of toxin-antitoxin system